MTNLKHIKSMTIDELTEWFDNFDIQEYSPWSKWFDKHYCQKCETIKKYSERFNRKLEYSYCELNDFKCRFFPELDEVPDYKQTIKMWLESEYEE